MKKYDGVLKRVRDIEFKRGISYAKTDGKLYKRLKLLFILAFAYTLAVNFLIEVGIYLNQSISSMSLMKEYLTTVTVLLILLITGFIFTMFKNCILNLLGSTVTVISALSVFITHYTFYLNNNLFILGEKSVVFPFITKHVISLFILLTSVIWMSIITVRAEVRTNRLYVKVTENLYNMYNIKADESGNMTDEQWEEFLKNYNPCYTPQILSGEAENDG